ncbi:hypothetical protein DS742_26225 [Lacrimispora amygdalina]|uniref:Uncharacterized protein n=1 Tax=Lacrimispora amygdalina TaxID=253257 RepID=A0A3E2N4M1_9FIRM|nr:hypothetical protein DS742_26225 [Clostridium indicum]
MFAKVGDVLNYQEVYNKLSDDLVNALNNFFSSLKLTKSFRARVTQKLSNKKYKVYYKKREYSVWSDFILEVDDMVWVCVPNGDWDSLYVQTSKNVGNKINTMKNYEFKEDGIYLNGIKIT